MSTEKTKAKKEPTTRKRASARVGEPVKTPHPHDILCGRGGQANYHIGNLNYRALVDLNKPLYAACQKRHKQVISKSIVATIARQEPPGRFLEQDGKSGLWYEIENKWAVRKTSQALREEQMEDSLSILGLDKLSLTTACKKGSPEHASSSEDLSVLGQFRRKASASATAKKIRQKRRTITKAKTLKNKKRTRAGSSEEQLSEKNNKKISVVEITPQKKRRVHASDESVGFCGQKATVELKTPSGNHFGPEPNTRQHLETACPTKTEPFSQSKAPVRAVSLDASVSMSELGLWLNGVEFADPDVIDGKAETSGVVIGIVCDCKAHRREYGATCHKCTHPLGSNPNEYGASAQGTDVSEISDEDTFALFDDFSANIEDVLHEAAVSP